MGKQANGQGRRWRGRVDVCIFVLHYGFTRVLFFPLTSVIKHRELSCLFVYVAVVTTGCIHLPM